jgi:hypothetical protein
MRYITAACLCAHFREEICVRSRSRNIECAAAIRHFSLGSGRRDLARRDKTIRISSAEALARAMFASVTLWASLS